MSDDDEIRVHVTSGYGARTRRGFVSVTFEDRRAIQLSSAEARRVAGLLLDTAGAADADAFLMAFMQQVVGVDEGQAAQLMLRFREWRKEQE